MDTLAATSDTTAQRLTRFVMEARVSDAVCERALPMILDTLAVTIAGSGEDAPQSTARSRQPAAGACVPCLWNETAYSPEDAALVFGTASHVLDYDDVSMLTVCHPSAPILSVLLCARPWEETPGRDLVEAFAIGTEMMIRIGEAMGFRHYALGFHATATLGTLGAAAAAARLMRLNATRTGHALAIAASMASGLRMNFGSMVKSLHVGIAASNGLKAAHLAAAGVEGAADAFENDGFLNAFTGGDVSHWPDAVTLGAPFAVDEPGFEQKRYPCCYLLHKPIEAALALRGEIGGGLADIEKVRVVYPIGGTKPLIHPFPRSGLNALFSAPYAVLAALEDGAINLRSFTDEAVLRADLQARLRDVEVVEKGEPLKSGREVGAAPVSVTVHMKSGRAFERSITALPGSRQDPLTTDQLEAKWVDCLSRAAPGAAQDGLRKTFHDGFALTEAPSVAGWLNAVRGLVVGKAG